MIILYNIFNTNLYKLNNSMDKKYYVYGLFEEDKDTPFYIGKGSGRRIIRYSLDDTRHGYMLVCKFKNLKAKNKKLDRKILFNDLSEQEAFDIEKELISKYGKRCDNTGILFNVTNGGDQPPSVEFIKKLYGEKKYIQQQNKRNHTFYENYYIKNFENALLIEKMLSDNMLIKDIAKKIAKHRNTISKWIKLYNIKYDNTYKKLLEIDRLNLYRGDNMKKIDKKSKTYIVVNPMGEEIKVLRLVKFCNDNNLDYRSLRNTYKRFCKNGKQRKCKKFWIKEQTDPST